MLTNVAKDLTIVHQQERLAQTRSEVSSVRATNATLGTENLAPWFCAKALPCRIIQE